ncbi:efflux RND transporter periplasmic adaptor subunit [Brevundimonas sp. 2R-24]|uniref:Efflux RND transporter periplasmic adaptor subunit n=1 Tax=Peiella sedimenti TaxID=3061083 RepID=A0ABT8SPR9_9CAUL|nr:efflux RND transporter periplasmic adaptor subunit [Caulobacteraceae bacterium XZ-24]
MNAPYTPPPSRTNARFAALARRHWFLALALGLILVMALAVLLRLTAGGAEEKGPGGPGGPGGRAQTVSLIQVQPREFRDRLEALGAASGLRSVEITSAATELVARVYFTDGQRVRAGQPLIQLQAGEESAAIAAASADLNQAERDLARWRDLAERGIAAPARLEQAETDFENARTRLEGAQARFGDRVIRAPFSGVMGLTDVTPGTLVNPGTVIATLDDLSSIRVDFPVPERRVSALRAGLPITARADALPGREFPGAIRLLDTRIDEQNRSLTARAVLPNADGALRPGMLVRVSIDQGVRTSLAAPEQAVLFEGDQAYVFRAVQGPDGMTAQRVLVETGAIEGGFVEILAGVGPGERIVVGGLNRLQPGAPIRVNGAGGGRAPAGKRP